MSSDESLTSKEQAAKYFRLNVTIPMLDDVITWLTDRFAQGQEDVMRGVMLIPSSVITVSNWKELLQPFLTLYVGEIPSLRTLDAELMLWDQWWKDKWSTKLRP